MTLAALLHTGPAGAGQAVIDPGADRIELSGRMILLHDPQGRLSRDDALSRLEAFRLAGRRDLVAGFNPGVFWLHVRVRNDGPLPLTRWLTVGTAKTQRVRLYLRDGEDWQVYNSGRAVARRDRPVFALDPVFPVQWGAGETRELLVRVDSRGTTDMQPRLWEPHAYRHAASDRLMKLAALMAGLLLSSVLALIVFLRMGEAQYLWLGLLMLAIAGLEASRENFLGSYFWPESLALPPGVLALFALIALFSLSRVVSHALELATHMPRAERMLRALRWSAVASFGLAMISYGHGVRLLSLIAVTQNLAILMLCALAWRQGHRMAAYFLLSFSIALLVEIARQLANLRVLPWLEAMEFSILFFLLASPLILLGLVEQTRLLSERLRVAEQLQQAKGNFLARISHELRAPLNTILGFNRMLARGSKRLSTAEASAGIEQGARRLLDLIDELLDEARAASGQLDIAPAPMAPRPWLDEIARHARLAAESNGNRLELEVSGQWPVRIEADGRRLRQVLENLLANANRHPRNGTIRLDCRASGSNADVTLEFSIEDTGDGIDPERQTLIFEPFVRADSRSAGHGLGLSICRELIRKMGAKSPCAACQARGAGLHSAFHAESSRWSRTCPIHLLALTARTWPEWAGRASWWWMMMRHNLDR